MNISLDHSLENSENHSNNVNESSQGSRNLLHDPNLNDSLRMSLNEAVMSSSNREQNMGSYPFQSSNRDQITYKVVQVDDASTTNPPTGLNIINASEFHNFLTQGPPATNGSQQAVKVSSTYNQPATVPSASVSSLAQSSKVSYLPVGRTSNASNEQDSSQTNQQSGQGPFYLLMSPQDVVNSQSSKTVSRNQFNIAKADDVRHVPTRRVLHNEVERRRRDKINTWIMQLSNIVPNCASDQTKQGQSKGGILAKACDYIFDLQTANRKSDDIDKKLERLQFELRVAQLQLKDQKQENEILHQTLRDHGIMIDLMPNVDT